MNDLVQISTSDSRWLKLIENDERSSIFHHPAWSLTLAECYGFRPVTLAQIDLGDQVVGGLPFMDLGSGLGRRRWVALPFTDMCHPLTDDLTNMSTQLASYQSAGGAKTIEVRSELPTSPDVSKRLVGHSHAIALSSAPEVMLSSFSSMHQRNIRTATRAGVQVRMGTSPDDLLAFYRLHVLTRQRLGVPVQPARFFKLLGDLVVGKGLGFFGVALRNNIVIAAGVYLTWRHTIVNKYAASDRSQSRYCANNLLTWEVIQWASRQGYKTFDWGRTDLDNDGLRTYKEGWGAVSAPLYYSHVGAQHVSIARTSQLQQAMATVIRRSPTWVCRLLGETLYKYSA